MATARLGSTWSGASSINRRELVGGLALRGTLMAIRSLPLSKQRGRASALTQTVRGFFLSAHPSYTTGQAHVRIVRSCVKEVPDGKDTGSGFRARGSRATRHLRPGRAPQARAWTPEGQAKRRQVDGLSRRDRAGIESEHRGN